MRAMFLQAIDNANSDKVCWLIGWLMKCLIVILAFVACAVISFRAGGVRAERRYEEWKERFANDFLSQQEAAARGMPVDPIAELQKQENTEFAKLISGLKLYNYGREDFITLAQCVKNRELNPAYPGTIVEVIQQKGQWPGYYDTNEVTESTYKLAASILDNIRSQEHQPCTSDLTIADFGDHITLRNTMDYNRNTMTWRYGQ